MFEQPSRNSQKKRVFSISFLLNLVGLMCLFTSLAAPISRPAVIQDFNLDYTLDRSGLPWLTYNDITLKIFIGNAEAVSATIDGNDIPVQYNKQTGYLYVTTSGSKLKVSVMSGTPSPKLGSFTKTILKYDRQWAWSHSFDDNVNIKQKGIPAFEQYGYRGTVFLIGKSIDAARNENWIIDRPDIIALVKKGWGIGNHSWSHEYVKDIGGAEAARQDVIKLATYLRQAVDEAGRKDYRLMSFAAPNFDASYQSVVNNLRATHTTDILFNESGNDSLLRLDPNVVDMDNPGFHSDQSLGRDWRVETYGSGDADDLSFRKDVTAMISKLNETHHYWLNTFTHGVDDKASNKSVLGFLTWVHTNYGPPGNNSVWVAPSEEIYSYMLMRDGIKITFTSTFPGTSDNNQNFLPLIKGSLNLTTSSKGDLN